MLASQRHDSILQLVNARGTISVNEICESLNASESTIRRDLNLLHNDKKLQKVFGGAKSIYSDFFITHESDITEKSNLNIDDKRVIAKYGASLIEPSSYVYIDSGTTTGLLPEFITASDCTFVTNGIEIARTLSTKNFKTILLGGNIRLKTDSIVGNEAVEALQKFHFIIGFFGTNGITDKEGFTTADSSEAFIKQTAMSHCKHPYILSDLSKFGKIYSVSFAKKEDATIITRNADAETLKHYNKIINLTDDVE